MTRGMFVTVLGNMAGIDISQYPGTRFDDVPASAYYASRINWATENWHCVRPGRQGVRLRTTR